MTQQHTISQTDIRMIYNDDNAIVDFLSDMPDRDLFRQLQKFVNFSNRDPNCILHKSSQGITLLLYKAPLGLNTGDNKLTIFYHKDLVTLHAWFRQWRDRVYVSDDAELFKALKEITELLSFHRLNEDDKSQAGYLG